MSVLCDIIHRAENIVVYAREGTQVSGEGKDFPMTSELLPRQLVCCKPPVPSLIKIYDLTVTTVPGEAVTQANSHRETKVPPPPPRKK